MLGGNALSLYNKEAKLINTYYEAIELLKKWYNSREKQTRLLSDWQGMRLSAAMELDPNASEISVYRNFVAKVMSTQKQLDASYHGDQYLRDQLMTSIDIPSVQDSLKDRVPRAAQQLINRVANRLSDKPNSAGTTSAYLISKGRTPYASPSTDGIYYTLGQEYWGESKRELNVSGRG